MTAEIEWPNLKYISYRATQQQTKRGNLLDAARVAADYIVFLADDIRVLVEEVERLKKDLANLRIHCEMLDEENRDLRQFVAAYDNWAADEDFGFGTTFDAMVDARERFD